MNPANPNRRDLLVTALGMPVLASGCISDPALPSLPPGELVGASAEVGHWLRNPQQLESANTVPEQYDVVVVGGGIAGLSAVRRLHEKGIDDCVLLELEPEVGGTSRSGVSSGVGHPWGAHYVPAPDDRNDDLISLFEEMGVLTGRDGNNQPEVAEEYRCRFPESRVFYRGNWFEGLYLQAGSTSDDKAQLQRFEKEINQWVDWRDGSGRPAFTIPMAASSDDVMVRELDSISMAQWLAERNYTSPRLLWFVNYACRDDYGMTADRTSAWAAIFYFAARKSSSTEPSRPFITWSNGNGQIVQHLRNGASKKIRTGRLVANISISEEEAGSPIAVTAINTKTKSPESYLAKKVVFAAPQFLARFLVQQYRQQAPEFTKSFQYSSWTVANLTMQRQPAEQGYPLAWDNVLYDSPSLGYVSASHQRGMDHGPHVWTYYYPLSQDGFQSDRQRLLESNRDSWADIVLTDLGRAHSDIRQRVNRLDVMRWGHAMIAPTPGFIWGGDRQAAAASVDGIHFAHSDLSGIALFEEAFYRGNAAADAVVVELQDASSLTIPPGSPPGGAVS